MLAAKRERGLRVPTLVFGLPYKIHETLSFKKPLNPKNSDPKP